MFQTFQLLLGAICCSEYFNPTPVVQHSITAHAEKRIFIDPHFHPGHNGIVQLFEWKWLDVAQECEEFLGPRKFGGVQVSPPNENVILEGRFWYERYQPMSFKIETRSGTEKEFLEMTRRCNAVGVRWVPNFFNQNNFKLKFIARIYADIVVNHMAADQQNYTAIGTAGSTATPTIRDYPAIPYTASNFHPTCALVDYTDAFQVRNCELVGLHDLNQTKEDTRGKIVNYLNHLIDLGVAGFRVDAAKHMWPSDLEIIYNRVKYLNSSFGFDDKADPFIYQEVIDNGNEAVSKYEYVFASVTEFRYSSEIGRAFTGRNDLFWLSGFGEKWNLLPTKFAVIFVDNHDSQRSGDDGILTYKMRKNYIMAQAFSLAHPYGIKRIMSSYDYQDTHQGPPADSDGNIISRGIDVTGNCTNGWICEHRWHSISSMVDFMGIVDDESITSWWDNGKNQIAFSRGSKAFVVFNLDNYDMKNVIIGTSMKEGLYCDIISGTKTSETSCSGELLEVKYDGSVSVYLSKDDPNGVIAIHVGQEIQLV